MDEIADKLAIQELVARYNMAWDAQEPDRVTACFTDDGVFVDAAGGEHAGRSAIDAFVRKSEELFGQMRHITSTHLVTFDGDDAATHRCYVVFVSHPGGERVLDTGGYEDHVVRTDGGWRFERRVVSFD